MIRDKLPLILAVLLYILIYFLRLQQGGWQPKTDFLTSQRKILDQRISQILPSPQAELLSGILLGQNKSLPGRLKLALRDTSTLHIVVASGQNLSIVAGFFLALSGLIKQKNAIVLSLLAVIGYTLLTGLQVPILRSAAMFSFAVAAQFFGRQKETRRILVLTAGLMLLVNPEWISDLSFQLSFLATWGVIVVAPILLRYSKFLPLLGQDLAVTVGAQLMVTPVILENFHQLSLVSIMANLMVGWTIPVIMILGAAVLLISFISISLAVGTGLILSALLTYFIYIVSFFSSSSFSWIYIGEQAWVVWAGYYLLLGGLLLALNRTKE